MGKLLTLTRFAIGRALVHAGLSVMPAGPVRSELFQLYEVWATRARDRAIKPYPHPLDME